MTPHTVIFALWIAWFASWFAASGWTNPTIKRAGSSREFLYRALMLGGAFLVFGFYFNGRIGAHRLWPAPAGALGWATVAAAAAGFLFCWWARLHLGKLWSSGVTRKNDHRIIDSGPYGIVRHPIYSGMILALAATVALHATAFSLLGAALWIAGIALKARLEERFLREELGPKEYDAYAGRVPMLLPYWPF